MTTVLLVVLAAVFGLLGAAKVAALGPMPQRAAHLGFSMTQYRGIGALELAGLPVCCSAECGTRSPLPLGSA